MLHPLDNPIWHALTSRQTALAVGDSLARRFPSDIGPLAGMIEQTSQAYAALAKLTQPEELLVLFLDQPVQLPESWTLAVGGQLVQMVCPQPIQVVHLPEIVALTEADVPEMLALTRLTKPGPFQPRTITLGGYVGIKVDGRLAAMAGERLQLEGYTEISAVCTHPDFQGRGYAQALIATVANRLLEKGITPFLHTGMDNYRAIRLYEALGFQHRRRLYLGVLGYPAHATQTV
jgi:predicted GNAT family acetyltransferase